MRTKTKKYKLGEEDQQRADMKKYIHKYFPGVFVNHRAENKSGRGLSSNFLQGVESGMPDEEYFAAKGTYHGLHVEQKIMKKDPFRIMPRKKCMAIENMDADGRYSGEAKHVRRQAYQISRLNARGYFACFAVGLSENIEIANWYLTGAKEKDFYWYHFDYVPPGEYFPLKCKIPIWKFRK